MSTIKLNLVYSGPQKEQEPEDQCIKAEVADAGLSESTCGNGNSDLYKAMLAMISGQPLPTSGSTSSFGATVWAQDLVGNGYGVNIAKGTLDRENSVTTQPQDLLSVSPAIVDLGKIDLEKQTGWVIDKIWSAAWAGTVFDEFGTPTVKPALRIDGTDIVLTPAVGVIGCLKIKYDLTRDKLTVANDGGGETEGDPYSTSLSFDVDGCDDEVILDLPADPCLAEQLGNAWDLDPYSGADIEVIETPPEETPYDTERVYEYCTLKYKSASPPGAAPADQDNAYLGIVPHKCDEPE